MAERLAAEDQFNKIEQTLRTKLAPIAPNDQFVGTLRQRLEGQPFMKNSIVWLFRCFQLHWGWL